MHCVKIQSALEKNNIFLLAYNGLDYTQNLKFLGCSKRDHFIQTSFSKLLVVITEL